jgi:hypothetical protein
MSVLLHLALAPAHYEEQPYIGIGFVIGSGLLIAAIWGIIHNQAWGWRLGAITCASMCLALLASRTTGLPLDYKEGWEPEAFAVLAVQVAFLATYFMITRKEVQP